MSYSDDDLLFCQAEFERLFEPDERLIATCRARVGLFLPDGAAAVDPLLERVEAAIRDRTPLSILRVGNGEGNAISMTKPALPETLVKAFYHEFCSQNGTSIPREEAVAFSMAVSEAIRAADVLGFRCFRVDEAAFVRRAIAARDGYAALGVLYAREFLQDQLRRGSLGRKIVTSAWIHLDVMPQLDRLLRAAESIVVITGRGALRAAFEARLGSRLREFIEVPVQGYVPPSPDLSHFSRVFPEIQRRLRQPLAGTLVLVGAGLFGKIYCNVARENGGVAVDLGSTFDILAGLTTRPVHNRYECARFSWL